MAIIDAKSVYDGAGRNRPQRSRDRTDRSPHNFNPADILTKMAGAHEELMYSLLKHSKLRIEAEAGHLAPGRQEETRRIRVSAQLFLGASVAETLNLLGHDGCWRTRPFREVTPAEGNGKGKEGKRQDEKQKHKCQICANLCLTSLEGVARRDAPKVQEARQPVCHVRGAWPAEHGINQVSPSRGG